MKRRFVHALAGVLGQFTYVSGTKCYLCLGPLISDLRIISALGLRPTHCTRKLLNFSTTRTCDSGTNWV